MIVITTVYEFNIDNICYLLLKLSIINISYDRAWVVERGFKNILKITMYTVFTHILYNTRLQGSASFIVVKTFNVNYLQ